MHDKHYEGFEKAMSEQKNRARASSQFAASSDNLQLDNVSETGFQGYNGISYPAKIVGILQDGKNIKEINAGDEAMVILDNTPFYGESGGQI